MTTALKAGDQVVLDRGHLQKLFDVLAARGYQLVGPTVRENAIVYSEIDSVSDLPEGWTDEQDAGTYRLKKTKENALFNYTVGPHAWKKYLHPAELCLWEAKRDGAGFRLDSNGSKLPRHAFVGVRSCELHAIAIQDKVLMHGEFLDPNYRRRREGIFLLAVNCGKAGGTCFCASMQTGPKVKSGFDLAMTEIVNAKRHDFVVEIGSAKGAEVLRAVAGRKAGEQDKTAADAVCAAAVGQMGRTMDTRDLKAILERNFASNRWDKIAERCLSCTNCTMVCPTCFCTTVEDVTDVAGKQAQRVRKWDSCFTQEFSYIHGGSVRTSVSARYRQWMTHKLASWIDQFGTSGCVGCGRCITWCPVGIDITEEARAIRETDSARKESGDGIA
jgi:ferredoxin